MSATCKWYVSIEQPECGKSAPHRVKVKTAATQATVDLCDEHYAVHNDNFARIRAARKAANL
jgi:hypothetical protein